MLRHLYVHLPFCPSICPYCCFHVEKADRGRMDAFPALLKLDLTAAGALPDLETVYLGGGTPTAFSTRVLAEILDLIAGFAPSLHACEVTMEANPSTLSPEKCRLLRERGVNRVSLGAQSFDPQVLKTLGRTHSAAAVREAWEILRGAGFENLNIDLMFCVPGQSPESWQRTLRSALELKPEHVSCYNLTYEEDTPFFEALQKGFFENDEEMGARMFLQAEDVLGAAGFEHYEISNYAQPGFECSHNLAYWTGRDYLGIGPSAVSFIDGSRWRLEGGARVEIEKMSPDRAQRERALLELRTNRGAASGAFSAKRWKPLVQDGLAIIRGDRLVLTQEGRLRADAIAVHLMD